MTVLTRPEGLTTEDLKFSPGTGRAGGGGGDVHRLLPRRPGPSAQPIVTSAEGLEVGMVFYPSADGFDLPAYVARPAGDGPFPVVIVVSEIFGLHAYIQDVCRRLAKMATPPSPRPSSSASRTRRRWRTCRRSWRSSRPPDTNRSWATSTRP